MTDRMTSFAVLGDWGIGKSSLLLKLAAICAQPQHGICPVSLSIGTDLMDYRCLAESLLEKLGETIATSHSIIERLCTEANDWKLRRVSVGAVTLERETPLFLSSGSALLRHALNDAWKRFLRPSHFNGAMFFLDDLNNLPRTVDGALALRDQFQSFAIEGLNYSVCFSAKADFFSGVLSFAEPAVRFYNKLYISHPYFLAFISRKLLTQARGSVPQSPARYWPEILKQLETEKFSCDLAHVSDKENELLRTLAKSAEYEFAPGQFVKQSDHVYFRRLTEKGLLIRTKRGKYKFYHPLFRVFLRGLNA